MSPLTGSKPRSMALLGGGIAAGVALTLVGVQVTGASPTSTTAASADVAAAGARSTAAPERIEPTSVPAAGPASTAGAATLTPTTTVAGSVTPLSRVEPVSLEIPAIDLKRTSFVPLDRNADGTSEVPTDFDDVGFYRPGPWPGQYGTAMIAGHVDSKAGPAVFYRLKELKPGDEVTIGRGDGQKATFVVDRLARYPKDQFPSQEVYGDPGRAELRLITCGGAFDASTGHYLDNIVVYAHLTGAA